MSYVGNRNADYTEHLSGNANKPPEYWARHHLTRGAKNALMRIHETGEWTTDPAILHHLKHHGLAVQHHGYKLTTLGKTIARNLSEVTNGR